jgi:hypothetical protein
VGKVSAEWQSSEDEITMVDPINDPNFDAEYKKNQLLNCCMIFQTFF